MNSKQKSAPSPVSNTTDQVVARTTLFEDLKKLCEEEEAQIELDEAGLTLFDKGCAAASERIVKEVRLLLAKHAAFEETDK